MICVPSVRAIAEPDAMNEVDRFVEALWAEHPEVPRTVRFRVGIAVREIAANIVKHATRGINRPVELRIWAVVRADDVLVTLIDDGLAAPEGILTCEMPPALNECGRGIPLAFATLRTLTYRRTDQINIWTLVSEHF